MASTPRISNTAVGVTSPIVVYEDSKEANDVASGFLKVYPAKVVSVVGQTSDSLYVSSIDPEDLGNADDAAAAEAEAAKAAKVIKKAPTLMDIQLISNKIVYDASGNPTASITFKVRNSSGENVQAVNARVKVL